MTERLRVSVRALVERALRRGDLNLESFPRRTPVEAIRAHQRLQASRGDGYRSEVSVSRVVEKDGLTLEVHGRIDGVRDQGETLLVEEIKTMRGDLDERARADDPTDWGQLRVYARILAEELGRESVDCRLTYYHLDTGETREIDRSFSIEALRSFFDDLVASYLRWARTLEAWREERDASIRALPFPHDRYRPGQREMAVEVYRALRDGKRLLVQAPTGMGKTLATLYPASKALGSGHPSRIFYLTARTTGRALAERALDELRGRGLRLRSVTLTAKEKICFNPEKACNGEECAFARGFFDRLDAAVEEALGESALTREAMESLGRKHRVCPFELSLELALAADVVIGDFNYVFDPRVVLRRVLDEAEAESFALLVDEAHNLVDRSRDMYSAEIRKTPFLALRRALDGGGQARLRRATLEVNRALLELRRRCEGEGGNLTTKQPPERLKAPLQRFVRECEALFSDAAIAGATRRAILERYFEALRFLRVAEAWSEAYRTVLEARDRELRANLYCVDPAPFVAETLDRARAAVFFSATLAPPGYFTRVLGVGEESRKLRFGSPFPSDRLGVVVASHVATTYRRRRDTEPEVTRLLIELVRQRPGKYLFYFPSYTYLGAIHERFAREEDGAEVLVQSPSMTEPERDLFLERFHEDPGTLVGFAVLGGFFGEGIDLPGDRLTGVAIVGVGLPGVCPEREQIREHFEGHKRSGFDYAYVYPGMSRVLQAAGRVVRSEADRGTVLLVDERFAEPRYRALLPDEWTLSTARSASELRSVLEAFWSSPSTVGA